MHSLRNILSKFVKDAGIEGGLALNNVRRQWEQIVGQTVSAHTSPDIIKGGILTIIVDTPQWMHHLSFYKDDISSKLGPFGIKGIRFRIGRLPVSAAEKEIIADAELSEEDLKYIDNTVRSIKDEELRNKFRNLIRKGLSKSKIKDQD